MNYVFLKPFALRFSLNWAELHSQDEPLRRGGGHISFVLKTRKPLLLHSSEKWSTQQNTTHTHELLVQILLSDELVKWSKRNRKLLACYMDKLSIERKGSVILVKCLGNTWSTVRRYFYCRNVKCLWYMVNICNYGWIDK